MKKAEIVKLFPIETDRLIIRQPTLDDVPALQAAMKARDKTLRKWMSWTSDEGMSAEGTAGYITSGQNPDNTLGIPLIAVDKDTEQFVLATGIHAKDDDFQTLLTGWWIAADYEGKGMAFEAMTALNNLSFSVIGTERIETEYYADNIRSKNLMERLGFVYVTTKPKAHSSHLDGQMMDIHEYILERKK
jgi:RimJ/RimL family protein N-acetyltransferase